jgi:hypothetical protein
VGAHEGGNEGHGKLFGKPADGQKHLELILQGEAVAGLYFHRSHSLAEHPEEPGLGQFHELLFRSGPGSGDSSEDPAARVFLASGPRQKFLDAVPRKHRVGMRINKPRGH